MNKKEQTPMEEFKQILEELNMKLVPCVLDQENNVTIVGPQRIMVITPHAAMPITNVHHRSIVIVSQAKFEELLETEQAYENLTTLYDNTVEELNESKSMNSAIRLDLSNMGNRINDIYENLEKMTIWQRLKVVFKGFSRWDLP